MRPDSALVLVESAKAGIGGGTGRAAAAVGISVEIASPERFLRVERDWRDLTGRAIAANAFMEPSVVAAAALADAVPVHVLLAWVVERDAGLRLVGAWAFACRRPTADLPFTVLKTPVHGHACLGIPVLDADFAQDALAKMLDAIMGEPDLPKLVEINSFDAAGPVAAVFEEALARRGSRHICFDARRRPQLINGEAEAASLSASRQRALRQKHRHLARHGQVTCTLHRDPAEIHQALDEFLALEMAGWKSRAIARGHAIRREPAREAFFRLAVEGLAACGLVRIRALRCDGKPVAMRITVRSGSTAFAWKSAYDETSKDCAPGLLLLQDETAALLADPGVHVVDSCNRRDDSYIAEFWSGRRPVLDMVMDVRKGMTPAFLLLGSIEASYHHLKVQARQARQAQRALRSARGSLSILQLMLSRLARGYR